jgi:hypothetical protein
LIFYLGLTATQQQPECMAVFNARAAGGSQSRGAGVPSSIRPFLIPAASAAFYPFLPVTLGKHAPA